MIEKHSDREKRLTVFKCNDGVIIEDLVGELIHFYQSSPTPFLLIDLTNAHIMGASTDNVRRYVEFVKNMGSIRSGGRTAIIVSSDLAYGLSRSFQIFSDIYSLGYETEVFRSVGEAMTWLLTKTYEYSHLDSKS